MGTLRFFEEVVSFKIRRTFGFADYRLSGPVLSRLSDLSYLFALACRRNSAQTTAVAIATLSDSEPLRSAG